jgi:hypothetical protein
MQEVNMGPRCVSSLYLFVSWGSVIYARIQVGLLVEWRKWCGHDLGGGGGVIDYCGKGTNGCGLLLTGKWDGGAGGHWSFRRRAEDTEAKSFRVPLLV